MWFHRGSRSGWAWSEVAAHFGTCDVQPVPCSLQASGNPVREGHRRPREPCERGPPETKRQAVRRGTDQRPLVGGPPSAADPVLPSSPARAAQRTVLLVGALQEMGFP